VAISKEQYEEECNRLLSIDRSQWPFEARVAYQLGLQEGRKEVFEKLNPQIQKLNQQVSENSWELDSLRQSVGEREATERGQWGIFG
jgi:hypothetical protein